MALLYPRLRPSDSHELTLSAGPDFLNTLIDSVEKSDAAAVAEANGVVIAIWGINNANGIGVPWFIGSEEVRFYKTELVQGGKAWVSTVAEYYPLLANCVHSDNRTSMEWLSHLGFTIGPLIPEFGAGKEPFHFFYLGKPEIAYAILQEFMKGNNQNV